MSFSGSSPTYRYSNKTPELNYANIPSSSSYAFGSSGALGTDRNWRVEPGISGVEFSNVQQSIPLGNEKSTMQNLNDRLASYLETVRSLEEKNSKLEVQIREALENSGPEGRDYSPYETILSQLRKEILDLTLGNARVVVQIDNTTMAVDDFKAKFEHQLQMRQGVEFDIQQLKKILDDTNLVRLHLENDVESLKHELISVKKKHQQEVTEIHDQIAQSGVQVDVDAPKGQDLAQIMEEMRAKYEKIALENQKELKVQHKSKIIDVEVQVTENTAALKEAHIQKSKLHKTLQALEIEIQSQYGLRASLEGSLQEINLHYNMQIEHYNAFILERETELAELRHNIQLQMQDYAALLNLKVKLEAEIETYRKLLDGGDVKLQDVHDEEKMLNVVTITKTVVGEQSMTSSAEVEETNI